MAPRASWKGYLKIAELTCPVALYAAVTSSERISFHVLNRKTGHRVHRQYVDSVTGKPVEPAETVKGYETGEGELITVEADELATAVPQGDKTLTVEGFIPCEAIDQSYFDRPYFLGPDGATGRECYALIRDGMRKENVAALARAVLFRRVRTLLVRAYGAGLLAVALKFDYEVRSAEDVFDEIADVRTKGEMLDLARHIIDTKRGKFDPAAFEDRYESALAELVRAKQAGEKVPTRKRAPKGKVVDLMSALRRSAEGGSSDGGKSAARRAKGKSSGRAGKSSSRSRKSSARQPRRKAG